MLFEGNNRYLLWQSYDIDNIELLIVKAGGKYSYQQSLES
jgi:hypothetical protein